MVFISSIEIANPMVENLISEAIGILLTVFLVDRIIAWRERRKSMPARHLLWVEIFGITDDILNDVVHYRFSTSSFLMYKFGEIQVSQQNALKDDLLTLHLDLIKELENNKAKYYSRPDPETEKDSDHFIYGIPSEGKMQVVLKKIDEVLLRSSILLDPEPLNFLFHARTRLLHLLKINRKEENWEAYSIYMYELAQDVAGVRSWFNEIVDKTLTLEEYLQEIDEHQKALVRKIPRLNKD